MTQGVLCTVGDGAATARSRVPRALCAALLYGALWGCLCGMAFLSTAGVPALLAGGVLAAALPLLPPRARRLAVLAALLFAAGWTLFRFSAVREGACYLLNRFFAASEARQAYTYALLPVAEATGVAELRAALVPLGLVTGLLAAAAPRSRAVHAGLLAGLALFAAWLGVAPGTPWLALLAAAAALPFLPDAATPGVTAALCAAVLFLAALAAVTVAALLPGEDARLSAWDESARDALALHTLAYTDRPEEAAPPPPRAETGQTFYREEETPSALGGDGEVWRRRAPVLLVIVLFALALFVPAILSDALRRRRARNRRGLDDPDGAVCVRAMFLYAMRHLRFAGLCAENLPYSHFASEIGTRFSPALRAEFERVLPLWQEAAYSAHPLGDAQRAAMRAFMDDAVSAARGALNRRQKFLLTYYYAL